MTSPTNTLPGTEPAADFGRAAPRRPGYLGLWRALPRTLGTLLLSLPFALASFAVLVSLFSVGLSTLIIVGGFFVLVAALLTARWFGDRWAGLIGGTLHRPIVRPAPRPVPQTGLVGRLRFQLSSAPDWRALLHAGLVHLPLSLALWSIVLTWSVVAVFGPTAWLWNRLIPETDATEHVSAWLLQTFPWMPLPADPLAGDAVLYGVTGLIFLATLPAVVRGLAVADWAVARSLLGETAGDRLQRDVAQLERARDRAASAEHRTLGQLERDLHDGPQQRLLRLQMDLATAHRRMADRPEAVPALLAEAKDTAAAALGELRALSRGVAPPLLADRGLRAALESIAGEAPVPTRVHWDMDEGTALSEVTERTLYFIASECLANVTKHAEAQRCDLYLAKDGAWVSLTASDDGRGGALAMPGHGLVGLRERAEGAGGSLTLSSPAGGPTVITARIPVSLGA